jgi:hypothetical protein
MVFLAAGTFNIYQDLPEDSGLRMRYTLSPSMITESNVRSFLGISAQRGLIVPGKWIRIQVLKQRLNVIRHSNLLLPIWSGLHGVCEDLIVAPGDHPAGKFTVAPHPGPHPLLQRVKPSKDAINLGINHFEELVAATNGPTERFPNDSVTGSEDVA